MPVDNFLTAGDPLLVKLMKALGYPVSYAGEWIWLDGKKVTTFAGGAPVSSYWENKGDGRIRTVEFYIRETKRWEVAAEGDPADMENAKVISVIEKRIADVRERIGRGLLVPCVAEVSAWAIDYTKRFVLLERFNLDSLNMGRSVCVKDGCDGNFYLIPPLRDE